MSTKAETRRELLETELERFVDILIAEENPEKILVFGSLATGDVHEWSDIDLVIVNQTNLPFMQRLHTVRRLLQPKEALDILYYTPQEFDELSQNRLFVQEEILKKGKVLYERER